jgi:hypothetical protein
MARPSSAVNPIVLATLLPASSAHMLEPLPRWQTMVLPAAARASCAGSTDDTYSYDSPWNP